MRKGSPSIVISVGSFVNDQNVDLFWGGIWQIVHNRTSVGHRITEGTQFRGGLFSEKVTDAV